MKHALSVILSLFIFAFASTLTAQPTTSGGETIGQPWTGSAAVTRTMQEIMSQPPLRAPGTERLSLEFEVERDHLPQNPASPNISAYPNLPDLQKADRVIRPFSPQTVSTTFLGSQLSEAGVYPPDVMGAVGPTQYIVAINGRFKSFNKTTGVADGVMNVNPDDFFSSVMTPPVSSNFTSDPRIRFDRLTNRWFIIIIDVPGGAGALPNRVLIAVSDGATITAGTVWTFFQFQQDLVTPTGNTGQFADYPSLGIDNNALYIGCNMFTAAGSYAGTSAWVVRKSSLTSGGPIVVTAFRNLTGTTGGPGPYTPQGVDNFDPSATEGYIIGVDNVQFGVLMIRRVSTPGGTPTMSANLSLTVPSTSFPDTVPHLGNTGGAAGQLDGLDDRLMSAVIRNGSLWTAHSIMVNNTGTASGTMTRNAVRWYQINNLTATPALVQSGTVFDNATPNDQTKRNYWIPGIMVSGQGHVALGFSTAGTSERINAGTVGRLSGDVAGTMQTPVLYTSSSTAYNPPGDPGGSGGRRWGDYSYISLDPNDDMTMWCIQEYCNSTNSWGVSVAKLLAPMPATPSSANPSSVGTGQSNVNIVLSGTSSGGTGFYDPGAGFSNRIAAAVNGGGVTVNSVTYTNPTSLTLNISVAGGAAVGARTVTVTNPDGQNATSLSGILTITNATCPAIVVSPSSLPNGAAGSSYNQSITASGGTAPYTYAVTTGSLPAGVTLSSGGLLSGTPTFGGTYNFTVTATDANSCTGERAYAWVVTGCPQITLSPTTLPNGTIGVAYSQTITASGGTSPYTYAVTAGSLPAGVSLSSDGILSGSPTGTGTANFTVTATDANSCTGARAYSITVDCPTITLSPTTLSNGTVGLAYNQTITSSGGTGPYTYAVTSGSLPAGLSLSSGGVISGTPSSSGSSSFTVTATDAASCTGNRAYTVQINSVGTILSVLGVKYSQDFNTLASTGTSSTVPTGWAFSESGSNANTTYTAGTGSAATGETYSFGAASNSERAFGGVQSGNLIPTIGAQFTNGTGTSITGLSINYSGEEWRLGTRNRFDTLKFQYSLDATSLTTGTWTSVPSLNYLTTDTSGVAGSRDGNTVKSSISSSISSISIADGSSFWIRWVDANPSGSDDGLAVDDFSLTPNGPGDPSATGASNPSTVVVGNTSLLTVTVTPGTNPTSTGITVEGDLSTIGGSATQAFFDNGTNGDVSAGDNSFSYRATVNIATSPGAKSLPMSVDDAQSRTASTTIALTVQGCPTITVSPASLPNGTFGSPYSQTVSASGGVSPYTIALSEGSLPASLTLGAGGSLSGTPAVVGSFNFTVQATDSNGCVGTRAYSLQIDCATISVSPTSLPNGIAGTAYSQTVTASGGKSPYSFAVTSGALPTGLSLAAGGGITGTPTAVDTFDFTITSTDSNNCTGSKAYTVIIGCPTITVSPATLPDASIGLAYNQSITASGGVGSYSYAITAGTLPGGLSLSGGGVLSGTPNSNGTFNFTVTATDANSCVGPRVYTISTSCPTITVAPASLPNATIGAAYSQSVSASGGVAPYSYGVTSGSLPTGFTLSPSGSITGTSNSTGTFNFTITASDSSSCTGSKGYSITMLCPAISIAPTNLGNGTKGNAYNQQLSGNGGIGSYTFAVTVGAMPPGLTLSSAGLISGAPTTLGSFDFSVTATDSMGCGGTTPYTVDIECPTLSLLPSTLPGDSLGGPYNETISGNGGTAPYTFVLLSGSLPDGLSISSGGVVSGTPTETGTFNFTVKATDADGCMGTRPYSILIDLGSLVLVEIPLQPKWNIVSNPLELDNDSTTAVFPGAVSQAYRYTPAMGYQPVSRLIPGYGEWLKFGSAHTQTLIGMPISSDSVDVNNGWNIVGSLSYTIASSAVQAIGTTIESQFFGYQNGYHAMDSLAPGEGYWVRVSSVGILYFSSGGGPARATYRHSLDLDGLTKLTIEDAVGNHQEMYLADRSFAQDKLEWYRLPPPPPMGVFDARFASQRMVEQLPARLDRGKEYRIDIRSAVAPLTIRLDRRDGEDARFSLRSAKTGRELAGFQQTGPAEVRIAEVDDLILKVQVKKLIPASFALHQNRPNPFNPTTRIEFDLPQSAVVTLNVVNILGQEVATVLNRVALDAGREEAVFDASILPSGIYFYRISAEPLEIDGKSSGQPFNAMKKMILLR